MQWWVPIVVFVQSSIAAPLALAGESMPLWLRCVMLGVEGGCIGVLAFVGRAPGTVKKDA